KSGLFEKATDQVTHLLETGTKDGIGKVDVIFDSGEAEARLLWAGRFLSIGLTGGRTLYLDSESGELRRPANTKVSEDTADDLGPHVVMPPPLHKRPILWAVDTVRAYVGPEPIAWLEGKVFGARDDFRRASYALFGGGEHAVAKEEEVPPPALDASAAG